MLTKRFTIYDMMQAKGVFAANSANPDSRTADGQVLYEGPVEYPKMFYHPEGLERIIQQGEVIETAYGPKVVGELRETICVEAKNAEDEKRLRADGWHDHPGDAAGAAGKPVPPRSSAEHVSKLESELERLKAELARAQAKAPIDQLVAPNKPGGGINAGVASASTTRVVQAAKPIEKSA